MNLKKLAVLSFSAVAAFSFFEADASGFNYIDAVGAVSVAKNGYTLNYEIIPDEYDDTSLSAVLVKIDGTLPSYLQIDSSVTFNGKKYDVTRIGHYDGGNETKIGAIAGSNTLEVLVLPNKLEKIEPTNLLGCPKFRELLTGTSATTTDKIGYFRMHGFIIQVVPDDRQTNLCNYRLFRYMPVGNSSETVEIGADYMKMAYSPSDPWSSYMWIDENCFREAAGVKTIHIGKGVGFASGDAFSFAPDLERFIVDSGNVMYDSTPSTGSGTITEDNHRTILAVATNSIDFRADGSYAFSPVTTRIASRAFEGTNIKKLSFDGTACNIKEVDPYAFNCSALEEADVKSGLEGYAMFRGCKNLRKLTFHGNRVQGWIAEGCSSLSDLDISSVAYIGGHAFEGCSSLTSVELFPYLTDVYENAFKNSGVKTFYCKGNPVTIPQHVEYVATGAFTGTQMQTAYISSNITGGGLTLMYSSFPSSLTKLYCDNKNWDWFHVTFHEDEFDGIFEDPNHLKNVSFFISDAKNPVQLSKWGKLYVPPLGIADKYMVAAADGSLSAPVEMFRLETGGNNISVGPNNKFSNPVVKLVKLTYHGSAGDVARTLENRYMTVDCGEEVAGKSVTIDYTVDGYQMSSTFDIKSADSVEGIMTDGTTLGLRFDGESLRTSSSARISVYNMSGSVVLEGDGESLDVRSLPAGVYVATAVSGTGSDTVKFIL